MIAYLDLQLVIFDRWFAVLHRRVEVKTPVLDTTFDKLDQREQDKHTYLGQINRRNLVLIQQLCPIDNHDATKTRRPALLYRFAFRRDERNECLNAQRPRVTLLPIWTRTREHDDALSRQLTLHIRDFFRRE